MTDQLEEREQDVGAPGVEVKSYSEAEVKALLDKETAGLKSKVDELLGEKKTVAQKAKEAEQRAMREAEERAKQENDFKSLFESSETKRKEIEEKYNGLNQSIRSEKRNGEAMRLATQMASGTNAELLSEFIQRRLDFNEEGKLVVLSDEGKPTVSTMADLKKELESSGRFDSLLDGTKSSGGAAKPKVGGANSGTDFSKMSKADKLEYFRQQRGE